MTFQKKVEPEAEIRQLELKDASAIFALVEQNRDYLREWLPWVDYTRSAADVEGFIERSIRQLEDGRGPNAGVFVEGQLRGAIGCHPIDWANRNCSIGYWLDAGLQGRGLISRCCAVLLDHLFDDHFLHRVTIRCGTGNKRSCAIPERLGFQREGVMREAEWVRDRWVGLVIWGMLAGDWRRARASAGGAHPVR